MQLSITESPSHGTQVKYNQVHILIITEKTKARWEKKLTTNLVQRLSHFSLHILR